MVSKRFFGLLDERWGSHTVDLFSFGANNHCARFYAMHWYRGDAVINAFAHILTGENCWISCSYSLFGKVWRTLREQKGLATMLIPLWESVPWWQVVSPDTNHFSDNVVD